MINVSKPDIVLLDIALNDLSGLDVLRRLREYDKNTKVIIVTGQMYPDEQIQEVFKLGVSGYEHKPIILEEIECLVNQVAGYKPSPVIPKSRTKTEVAEEIPQNFIVHKLTNLLGIIRNKCENFVLNIEEGIYKDKSAEELVKMSVSIMKDIEETVDRSMKVVEQIKGNKKT
jgi:response regulator of citrate/malate metabolism